MTHSTETTNVTHINQDQRLDRVLRWPEVQKRTGLCRSHAHDLARKGKFPSPIKLGGRASGWMESEVVAWIVDRIAVSRGSQESQGGEAA